MLTWNLTRSVLRGKIMKIKMLEQITIDLRTLRTTRAFYSVYSEIYSFFLTTPRRVRRDDEFFARSISVSQPFYYYRPLRQYFFRPWTTSILRKLRIPYFFSHFQEYTNQLEKCVFLCYILWDRGPPMIDTQTTGGETDLDD